MKVRRNKSGTYHSYEAALRRKEQLDLVQLHEKERAQCREGTLAQLLEGNAVCMMYLYRNWSFSPRVEEDTAQLTALAEDIIDNYEECDGVFLTEEVVAETMKIADRVYVFSRRVLKDSICLSPCSGPNTVQRICSAGV